MLFAESLESVKCLEEGVIESVADANIGSILGIGFPAGREACSSTSTATTTPPAAARRFVARARSSLPGTASASSRRLRWSRRPSGARRTPTRKSQ